MGLKTQPQSREAGAQPDPSTPQGENHARSREAWADRVVPVLLVLGVVLVAIDVVWTFTLAPMVKGALLDEPVVVAGQVLSNKLLFSQKIFYLHVPVAVASFVIMAVSAWYALRFLMTKNHGYDVRSKTAMEVSLVFILATMVSGDLWTRFDWGVWWTWEPRLTTYFILMLLAIGYFILRNAIDDPERRARFCAVFALIAFVDAPISFMITRLVPSSTHPVVFRSDSGLPPLMLIPFLLGLFGMLLLSIALYRVALRVHADAQRVEELKEMLEIQDSRATQAAAEDALRRLQQGVVLASDEDQGERQRSGEDQDGRQRAGEDQKDQQRADEHKDVQRSDDCAGSHTVCASDTQACGEE